MLEHKKLIVAISLALSAQTSQSQFDATIELSSLNSENGMTLNGVAASDISGQAVSTAGDVNGDGIDDLIIGAPWSKPGDKWYAGRSYVVFGSDQGLPSTFNLFAIDGMNGFTLNGVAAYDESGQSVSTAGDVNGDGIDDLIIGAPYSEPGGNRFAGRSYVVFGSDQGFSSSIELSALNGSNGFTLNGVAAFDKSGQSVSTAGDVNGDGIDDLIFGAPGSAPGGKTNAGRSYVVFGSDQGFSNLFDLSTINGLNGFTLNGAVLGDFSGQSVSSAGDVNGDGIDDVIIGAPGSDPSGNSAAGSSYVVFGSDQGFSSTLDLSTLDGMNGFILNGVTAGDQSGSSVSAAGDVNGDGIDDLIIGAFGSDPGGNSFAGSSYVVFGSDQGFSNSIELSTLNGMNGFTLNGIASGDRLGASVSNAGDVNGDGFDDLVIGAYYRNPVGRSDAGSSYVVFGSDQGFPNSIDLLTLNGMNGFTLNGAIAGDQSGSSVSAAGDVNGDGIDDLIVGAPRSDPGGKSNAGRSYVVFGREKPIFKDGFD